MRLSAELVAGMEAVGARVRALRESAGLTQAALAARAGVSRMLVCKLERGTAMHVLLLSRVAGALGVGLDGLVGGVALGPQGERTNVEAA